MTIQLFLCNTLFDSIYSPYWIIPHISCSVWSGISKSFYLCGAVDLVVLSLFTLYQVRLHFLNRPRKIGEIMSTNNYYLLLSAVVYWIKSLRNNVLCCGVLYCGVLYCGVLYWVVLYFNVSMCTALNWIVLYCIELNCIVPFRWIAPHLFTPRKVLNSGPLLAQSHPYKR